LKVWANRALFYLAKMYTEQIKQGQDYNVLKKCVSISILDFDLFTDQKEYYSCFHIREDTRHILYTDRMEFHVIELPKLPVEGKEKGNGILLWAKFINAERKEEFDMLAKQDAYINSAYQHLQVISQDKQKRMEYEARQKAILDYNQGMKEATQRGIEIGEKRGMEIGEKRGMEIGEKRGMEIGEKRGMEIGEKRGMDEKALEIARNMIARGFGLEDVLDMTGLTAEQVENLK